MDQISFLFHLILVDPMTNVLVAMARTFSGSDDTTTQSTTMASPAVSTRSAEDRRSSRDDDTIVLQIC